MELRFTQRHYALTSQNQRKSPQHHLSSSSSSRETVLRIRVSTMEIPYPVQILVGVTFISWSLPHHFRQDVPTNFGHRAFRRWYLACRLLFAIGLPRVLGICWLLQAPFISSVGVAAGLFLSSLLLSFPSHGLWISRDEQWCIHANDTPYPEETLPAPVTHHCASPR